MLSLALVFQNDQATLPAALSALKGVATADNALVFVDQGSQDGSREIVHHFMREHGGHLIVLETSVPIHEAAQLVQCEIEADYVLPLSPLDRINIPAWNGLAEHLSRRPVDVMVLPSCFWFHSAQVQLSGPDADRFKSLSTEPTPHDIQMLWPDSRRLITRTGGIPEGDLEAWEQAIETATTRTVYKDPVLLRPLPVLGARDVFHFFLAGFMALPPSPKENWGERRLQWATDALQLLSSKEALQFADIGASFLNALSKAARHELRQSSTPIGRLMDALDRGDHSFVFAQLALYSNARLETLIEAQNIAHSKGYTALRRDLDLALPGPEYLQYLYGHLRSS